MMLRQCPVTKGLETRMTEGSFARMCARFVGAAAEARKQQDAGGSSSVNTYCVDQCGGKTPPELTLLPIEGIMGTVKECSGCKRTISIRGGGLCHRCFKAQNEQPAPNKQEVVEATPLPVNSTPPPEVVEALVILQGDRDLDTLAETCRQRMQLISDLEEVIMSQQEEIKAMRRERNASQTQPKALEPYPAGSMAYYIDQSCHLMREMLLVKNQAYGNSVGEPVRIFSRCSPLEQINVRIDDKLSRLLKGGDYPGDNDELDLTGYLILKLAVKSWMQNQVEQKQAQEAA